jgi:hypothetical protein
LWLSDLGDLLAGLVELVTSLGAFLAPPDATLLSALAARDPPRGDNSGAGRGAASTGAMMRRPAMKVEARMLYRLTSRKRKKEKKV